jgi:hypothetical protein
MKIAIIMKIAITIIAMLHTAAMAATRTSIMVIAIVAKAITTNHRLAIGCRHIKFGAVAFG